MSELSLLERVRVELKALGCTNMRCEEEERLSVFNESITIAFETTWNDDNQQTAVHTPKAIALIARDIEQFADITIISSPELNTLHEYMQKVAGQRRAQVLRWNFSFRLNGTTECKVASDLTMQQHIGRFTWPVIADYFEGADRRIIMGKNLEQQLWTFRNSPPVRFLMGIGSVLIKEEWHMGEI